MDIKFGLIQTLVQTNTEKAGKARQLFQKTGETAKTEERFDSYISQHHPLANVYKLKDNERIVIDGQELKDLLFDIDQERKEADATINPNIADRPYIPKAKRKLYFSIEEDFVRRYVEFTIEHPQDGDVLIIDA